MSIFETIKDKLGSAYNKSKSFVVDNKNEIALTPITATSPVFQMISNIAKQVAPVQYKKATEAVVEKAPRAIRQFGVDVAQSIPRAVATVGMSAGNLPAQLNNELFQKPRGKQEFPLPFSEPVDMSNSVFGKIAFGQRPLSSFQQSVPKAKEYAQEKLGLSPTASKFGAPLVVMGGTILDLTGLGGGAKNAALKKIAESKADDVISGILRKTFNLTDDAAIKELTPLLKEADTPAKVTKVIDDYNAAVKNITTPSVSTLETPKPPVASELPPSTDQNLLEKPLDISYTNTVPQGEDSVKKLMQALDEAVPLRTKQEKLYAKDRSQKFAKLMGAREGAVGEAGFKQELGALKGELTKVDYESLRGKISQADVDNIFNVVRDSKKIGEWEKLDAQKGLIKMLEGQVPTRSELEKLGKVFPKEMVDTLISKGPQMSKVLQTLKDVISIPRTIKSSFDLSAPLRQGVFMLGKPKQFTQSFGKMFKQFASEKSYQAAQEAITSRPTYKAMRDARLAITDLGDDILTREESFMSRLTEKVPGVRASARAYTGFLNNLRADVFDDIMRKAKIAGKDTSDPEFLQSLGSFINSATGRGTLPKVFGIDTEAAAPVLNAVLFSPRLLASRLNMLNPLFYIKQDPLVRKEMLKTLGGTGATLATIYGLAKLGGADIGTDFRSSDAGKIKVGNTRYDITGGFQQYIKLATQLATGKIISSTSGKEITLGEGYKPMTRLDIIGRFFAGKENPIASFIHGLLNGQDAMGNDFRPNEKILDLFIPLMASDLYDLQKEHPGLIGAGMGVPGVFGVGSQTYGKQKLEEGTNQVGEKSLSIIPETGLTEDLANKIFGKADLKSSSLTNIETYYDQMKAMPRDEAIATWKKIYEANPELAKKIKQVEEDRKLGVTVNDRTIKQKGVENGDRAMAIYKKLEKLDTAGDKTALWNDYVNKKIITPDVAAQLKLLLAEQNK